MNRNRSRRLRMSSEVEERVNYQEEVSGHLEKQSLVVVRRKTWLEGCQGSCGGGGEISSLGIVPLMAHPSC